MSGTVCYLERAGGGSIIRRVRLVGPQSDRSWIADAPADDGGEVRSGASALTAARAAARWVAEQLERGSRELASVCLDPDGGLCVWLSAPSSDPAVVAAAMVQHSAAALDSSGDGMGGGPGSTAGAEGPLAVASEGNGMNRSVQALAAPGSGSARGKRGSSLLSLGRHAGAGAVAENRRMGVISVPDAPVRVFLDELDILGVTVGTVETLWHAAAAAWDPGAERGDGLTDLQSNREREAATVAPCSAVVLVDSPGRLVWAWSAGGELIAGGTMRVLQAPRPHSDGPVPEGSESHNGAARRIGGPDHAHESAVLCGPPEVGRLLTDWLAWSAQLGASPTRIVCVGATASPVEGVSGLPEALAHGWPSATVDATTAPDPVGSTLARLAGGREIVRASDGTADPRLSLVALTHRPGRSHRRMYQWIAVSTVALAAAVGALGWRLNSIAGETRAAREGMRVAQREALTSLEPLAPGVSTSDTPLDLLQAAVNGLRKTRVEVVHELPAVQEFARVLDALAGHDELTLDLLDINSIAGEVRLTMPETDAATGPAVTLRVQQTPGRMAWIGESVSSLGASTGRQWVLRGVWPPQSRPGAGGTR